MNLKFFKNNVINFFWKAFLKDVFYFLDKTNYKVGKICSNKVKVLSKWHPGLEKFNETNFVIINENFLYNDFCYNVVFNKYNVMVYE